MNSTLVYNPSQQTFRDLRDLPSPSRPSQGRRRAPNQARNRYQAPNGHGPRPGALAPCRAVVCLMNHHTGTPFSVGTSPELEGQLPSERALLAVGYSGILPSGANLKRMALYGCREGEFLFRFATSFNPVTGEVIPAKGEKQPRAAELAAINWIQGALFHNELRPGIFDFAQRELVDDLPKRSEFAAERRPEASQEMFSRFLARQGDSEKLSVPTITPLLTGAQLPQDRSPSTLPVREFLMGADSYRAHALDRFVLGLNRTTGANFESFKRAFIMQFRQADEIIAATASDPTSLKVVTAAAVSTGFSSDPAAEGETGMLQFVRSYLTDLELPQDVLTRSYLVGYQAVKMLENYFLNRTEDGRVIMYAPALGQPTDVALFRKPSTFTVSGSPVTITDRVPSDGRFPYNAAELLGE